MGRCAVEESLNRYLNEQEKQDKLCEEAIEEFRCSMDEFVAQLASEFNKLARNSSINRNELRNILLEDIGEQL